MKRERTAIPHIYLEPDGTTVCERCGARHRMSDADVLATNMTTSRAWFAKHKACPSRALS